MRLVIAPLVALGLVVVLSGCKEESDKKSTRAPDAPAAEADAAAAASGVTYLQDVKPILDAYCVGCHTAGGAGPGDFSSHELAAPQAGAIAAAVLARRMPPWPADPSCNEYVGSKALAEEQKQALKAWADAGAPQGEAEGPALPNPDDELTLSRVDMEVAMKETYVPITGPDDYRCFTLDVPEKDAFYVTGLGVTPGNLSIVHHVILYLVPPDLAKFYEDADGKDGHPGFHCPGTMTLDIGWLGAWVPGSVGQDYPEGTGIKVVPGSKMVIQMHYNTGGSHDHGLRLHDGPHAKDGDLTSVQLRTAKTVAKEAFILPFTDPAWLAKSTAMKIPAGKKGVAHEYTVDYTPMFGDKAFTIYGGGLHLHTLGKSAKLEVKKKACLFDVPKWDFNWQLNYMLKEPVRVEPGDELSLRCVWDNDKPGAKDVGWGEGTNDEMCLGMIYVTRD